MRSFLLFFCLLTLSAWSHDFWLQPESGGAALIYGHRDQRNDYRERVVKKVEARDSRGQAVTVNTLYDASLVRLRHSPLATVVAAEVDTGFWVKTVHGWRNRSKKGESRYLQSHWSRHWAKLVRANDQAKVGHPLEFVDLRRQGETLAGRVVLRGKPVTDAPIYQNHNRVTRTDSGGRFSLKVAPSETAILMVNHKEELVDHPDADSLKLAATVTCPPFE